MNSEYTNTVSGNVPDPPGEHYPAIVAKGVIKGFGSCFLDEAGCLYIEGHGKMPNWNAYLAAPWHGMRKAIRSVQFSGEITSIGAYAFDGCGNLTAITVPDTVICIGKRAFFLCSALQEISLSKSLNSVDEYAFCGCRSLTEITVPDTVVSIKKGIFSGCSGLQKVTFPLHLRQPDFKDFYGCPEDIVTFTGAAIVAEGGFCNNFGRWTYDTHRCLRIDGIRDMPDFHKDDEIPWFDMRDKITAVYLSDSITSIGEFAFSGCKSLQSINIPESVASIGGEAFYGCKSLQNITIPDSITSIGCDVFSGCESLQSINIPESVASIGGWAFCGCKSLQSITIPESVASISMWAFYGCESLQSITIPNSVTELGEDIFKGCTSLENVTMSVLFQRPDFEEFFGCPADIVTFTGTAIVAEGEIGDGGTWILNQAGCLYIDGIEDIPDWDKCEDVPWHDIHDAIRSVRFSGSVTSIGKCAFCDCENLQYIDLPDGLIKIGDWAFSGCESLTEINIPDGVISIGCDAFKGCRSLTEITIPNSVTKLGSDVFTGCSSLKNIQMPELFKWDFPEDWNWEAHDWENPPEVEEFGKQYGCDPDIVDFT